MPAAWTKPDAIPALREELRKTSKNKYAIERGYEFPRAWKVSYDEMADRSYGYGLSTDWDYLQLGIYSLTTELWNPEVDIPGFPKTAAAGDGAGAARQRALLQYNDKQYGGRAFVAWKPFKHPELGDGEIGGWNPKYASNAWPGDILKGVCDRHVAVRAVPRGADAGSRDHRSLGARRVRRAERDAGGGRREGRHGGRDEGRAARPNTGCSR